MPIQSIVKHDKATAGRAAAFHGANLIREAIRGNGRASIVVATGASQFEMLSALVKEDIAWEKVTAFHLDEYVGLPVSHPASFRKYLWERFHSLLPRPLCNMHYVAGDESAIEECRRLSKLIAAHPVDVCFAGIGENGHLAFNDPPADFETEQPFLVVNLDDACRKQQFSEGWFPALNEVPRQAISMSIRQILKSRSIIVTAPDSRKAEAIKSSLKGPINNRVPSSILQRHLDATVYLDPASAALLR